jgi:hypothetical protein
VKQTVVIGERVPSENELRGAHRFALSSHSKKARDGVAAALTRAGVSSPTWPVAVTFTRISPGYLDDDNLRGAFKAYRDGVADWLGVDDRDARVSWDYLQAGCPLRESGYAVELADQRDGADRRVVLSGVPARIGASVGATEKRVAGDVPRGPVTQLPLPSLPTFVRLPWEQMEGSPARIKKIAIGGDPPATVSLVVPVEALRSRWGAGKKAGTVVTLHRRIRRRRGSGDVYCYEERPR